MFLVIIDSPDTFKDIIILIQDVRALYHSLDIDETIKIVFEAMMESEVKFDDVDIKDVAKYIAISMSQEDQRKLSIISCIPDRVVELEGEVKGEVGMAYLDSEYLSRKDQRASRPRLISGHGRMI